MRRTRTELRRWAWSVFACGLLAGVPLAPGVARAQDSSERAAAREHFAKGVALAKTRAYAAALSEFQQAYTAVPHFSVLYNIGQAQVALGQSADAIATLQRYLDEGGANVDAKRRAEVEATLARERAHLPPEPVDFTFTPPAPAVTPAAPAPAAIAPVPAAPPVPATRAAPVPTSPAAASAAPPPAPTAPASAGARRKRLHAKNTASPESHRTLAYVVSGVGLALSGGALAHYLWNRSRYQDWQSKYATYFRDPTEPNRNAANQLSKSIDDASAITVVLAVGAGVALGSGGILWVTNRAPGSDSRRAGFEPFVSAQGTF